MASDPLSGVRTRGVAVLAGDGHPPGARRAASTVRGHADVDSPGRTRGGGQGVLRERAPRRVGSSDPLAARAAELHTRALEADALAARYRSERDALIWRLRADEPGRWSYTALARALGCSRELIAQIVRRAQ